jgi:hypothetical protein
MKTSLLTSSDFCLSSVVFCPLLCSVIFCLLLVSTLSEVGSDRTVWRSPPSTVELSRSSPLLWFGSSLPCERKLFYKRCLGIDVTLYATHCFFSRIRCCGNMITEPLSKNGRLALPNLLRLSGVMSQYVYKLRSWNASLNEEKCFGISRDPLRQPHGIQLTSSRHACYRLVMWWDQEWYLITFCSSVYCFVAAEVERWAALSSNVL